MIVLTCHRAAIEALRAADPAGFDDRVTLLDFDRPASARQAEGGPLSSEQRG